MHFYFKEFAELRHILDKAPALQGVASAFALGVDMIPFLLEEVGEKPLCFVGRVGNLDKTVGNHLIYNYQSPTVKGSLTYH